MTKVFPIALVVLNGCAAVVYAAQGPDSLRKAVFYLASAVIISVVTW
ncbi:MAG: hypothetical protein M0Z38_13200 [Deltaproteobacteria bacterium]|nr:hypothetical protein [Deltaproteobacteria bacterium]